MSYSQQIEDRGIDVQRHVVGLVAAACAAALVGSGILTLEAIQREGNVVFITVLFLFFPILAAVSGIAGLVVGIPITFVLSRLRLENLFSYVLTGFCVGVAIAKFLFTSEYRDTLSFYSQVGGMPGVIWGITWWLVARRPANA